MSYTSLNNKIAFRIFDKRFKLSNGIYGVHRYQDEVNQKKVRSNYNAILNALDGSQLLIMRHVHGDTVIDADLVTDLTLEPEADGAVITKEGLILSVQSADCVPILIASDDGQIIGVAHCGWKSLASNILNNVVQKMKEKGANKITALVGPSIHQQSYEVTQSFYEEIIKQEASAKNLFVQSLKSDHYSFDLIRFAILKLNFLGITNILNFSEDTYSNPDKYYSYRRDCHLGIKGNQTNILSTIIIKS